MKGGARNNNRAQSARKFLTTPTKQPRSSTNGSKKASFLHFGCIFVVSFMIDPSLRGLHWLEGGGLGSIFVLKKPIFLG